MGNKTKQMNFYKDCHPMQVLPSLLCREGETPVVVQKVQNKNSSSDSNKKSSSSDNTTTQKSTKPFHGNQYTMSPEQLKQRKLAKDQAEKDKQDRKRKLEKDQQDRVDKAD